jgi:hypothetical protein
LVAASGLKLWSFPFQFFCLFAGPRITALIVYNKRSQWGTVRSSTTRSGQGAPGTASKVSLWLVNGRNEPKRVSGSTIRSTLRSAAVRHICSGAWPTSGDKPTSRPRCRTSHIRQSIAALAESESGEVGRSSLQDAGPDSKGFPCINVSRAVKSPVSSMANSTAGLDSARRSVRRSSCVSLDGNP